VNSNLKITNKLKKCSVAIGRHHDSMYLEVGYCSFHIEMQKGSIDIQTQGLHMKVADLSSNEFAGSVDAQR